MKVSVASGAVVAMAAAALALASATPASAKHKHHHRHKASAGKMACGGKNGCPSKKTDDPTTSAPAK